MVDIFDEKTYIKNILKDGFSLKWKRDASILARYYKSKGCSKKEIKEKIIEKCEKYVDGFDIYISYKTINNIVNNAWKSDGELRVISFLEVDKEILNWFITREELTNAEQRVLFTIYGWTLIQAQYVEYPAWHNLSGYTTLFKENANIPQGTNLTKIKKHLCDLGYIKSSSEVRKSRGISKCLLYAKFIEDYEIFQRELGEDKIIINYEDMYALGNFLEEYRKKKRVKKTKIKVNKDELVMCKCGREFIKTPNTKREICEECYKEERKFKKAESTRKSREILNI